MRRTVMSMTATVMSVTIVKLIPMTEPALRDLLLLWTAPRTRAAPESGRRTWLGLLLLLLLLLLRGMSLPRPGSTDIATTRHRALCLACTASVPPDGLPR